MANCVMYLFANRGANMNSGKMAAQVAHAAVEAFRVSDLNRIDQWYEGGHYTKIVLLARDSEHLRDIQSYVEARGFKTSLIIDEGRTEVDPHTPTALGVEIVDRDFNHVREAFSSFEVFRDTLKVTLELER